MANSESNLNCTGDKESFFQTLLDEKCVRQMLLYLDLIADFI